MLLKKTQPLLPKLSYRSCPSALQPIRCGEAAPIQDIIKLMSGIRTKCFPISSRGWSDPSQRLRQSDRTG